MPLAYAFSHVRCVRLTFLEAEIAMTIGQLVDHLQQRVDQTWRNPSWWNLLVVLPWTIGLVFLIYEWKLDRAVAERQQTTQGRITVHEPSNHNRYGYVFTVNGRSYTGWQSPRAGEFEIGKQVVVYYDPKDPAKNALTDFSELSIQSLGPVPLLMFGIGAVAVFILRRRRRNLAASKIPA